MRSFGFRTLFVGQQALLYDHKGAARVEIGPKRIFLFRERLIPLQKHTADQNEYLIVTHRKGAVSHKPGPCVLYQNPLEHKHIKVESCIDLDANEVLVVYRQDPVTKQVERYLEHGPTRFIPTANEWLHHFSWHGTDPSNKTQMVAGGNKFTKLQVIPNQFYYNVDEVRTADDALIRVKLMMIYELVDIEKMLTNTADPTADFINCLCADVIDYCSKVTYMEFMERSGDLNELTNFPQLVERCTMIGYSVSKVVFRGYYASPTLQKLHDSTGAKRTQLKLAQENEEQVQIMKKKTLESDMQRISLEQSLDLENLQHRQKMEKSQKLHALEMKGKDAMEKLQRLKAEAESKLESKKLADDQQMAYLESLHGMDVNVNTFLLSQNAPPAKVIRVMAEKGSTNLHLHQ